ncbi:rRNA maturation RNase YbeY [Chloroflexota bacterium]
MEINILIDGEFEECPEISWLQEVVEQVLVAQGTSPDAELSLVITGQERVQELNKCYRDKDAPTDVLAFYMVPEVEQIETGSPHFIAPPDGVLHLGEVIISYPQAVIQAQEQRHSIKKEITILIIHGVLHLLGYDHEKPEQGHEMRAEEEKILNSIEVA